MRKSPLIALAALLTLPALSTAFQPPASLVPFLPANNVVVITPVIPSPVANTDEYLVTLPNGAPALPPLFVTAGTSAKRVAALGSAGLAFNKFKAATLTPAQQINPLQVQAATVYFMNNVGRPFYGL